MVEGETPLTPEQIKGAVTNFGEECKEHLKEFLERGRVPSEPRSSIRLSRMGVPCSRQHWYEHKGVEPDEPLRASTLNKFFFGHLLESFLTSLIRLSGHDLRGEQDELSIEGVKGHRDGVVDGHTVDIKSASTFSFNRMRSGGLVDNDSFGYIPQLWSYSSADEETSDTPFILAIDKQHGHIAEVSLPHTDSDIEELRGSINERVKELEGEEPPDREFEPVPHGKSGNLKLGTNCSYCPFKKTCWGDELKPYLYSTGPVWFTHIEKEPKVPELEERDSEF